MVDARWHRVLRFPIGQNLMPLLSYLKTHNISHHVTEESGQQQLWIADASQIHNVAEYASRWASGDLNVNEKMSGLAPFTAKKPLSISISKPLIILHLFRLLPVTMMVMLLGFIGIILFKLDSVQFSYINPFLFQKIQSGSFLSLQETLKLGEYWRLLTPTFLHFSFLHVVFNALFMWVIGQRIESVKGRLHYLAIVIFIGLIANIAQYMAQANTIFGGLSGVVYGLVGYIAVYQRYISHPILQFDQSMIIMFIVVLLLGLLGVMDLFIAGRVANTAHIAGLGTGAIIGWLMAIVDMRKSK